jgi:5-amino-6-(5-phospho-D-ribitylamino)uracil phosphatase
MHQRLYISDLDGTLLGGDRLLGARTRRVLEAFIGGGGLFTIATGRSAASCAATLGGLELAMPVITHNGALTCDLSPFVVRSVRAMPGPAAAALFAAAIGRGLSPVAYGLDGAGRVLLLHGARLNAPTRRYVDSLSTLHPSTADDGTRLAGLQGLSLILLDEPAALATFLAELCGAQRGFCSSLGRSAYTPGLGVGEVQSAAASKGVAAAELCARLGLEPAQIVAFGDNCNDLPLLLLAGAAFCPPDAQPEVLEAVGGRIGRAADEGVAAFLEALLNDHLDLAGPLR